MDVREGRGKREEREGGERGIGDGKRSQRTKYLVRVVRAV